MNLAVSATYVTDGDAILADIYLIDGEKYVPNIIESGRIKLIHGGSILVDLPIDRRMGNSDGQIHVYFNHPARYAAVTCQVSLDLESGDNISTSVPVLIENEESIPLAQQPEIDNPDVMQRTAIEEGL